MKIKQIHSSKKGIAFNLVTLIILAVVIIVSVVLFIRSYKVASDSGARELCNLEGIKSEVTNIKGVSFWKTYELNCKAEDVFLKSSDVDAITMTQNMTTAAKSIFGAAASSSVAITQIKLQSYFANKLNTCWQITGNNSIIQGSALPETTTIRDTDNIARYTLYDSRKIIPSSQQDSVTAGIRTNGITITACMICSTTYFDKGLQQDILNKQDLTQLLQNTQGSGGQTLFNTLLTSSVAGGGPTQIFTTQTPQSVIYYQLLHYGAIKSATQETFTISATPTMTGVGTMIIPTVQIPTMCDIVVNQG